MTREVNRVTKVVLAAFAVIALSSLFWTVFQADSMVARPDNARNVIDEQRIRRGAIYDQDGARLAYSEANEAGLMERVYPEPAAVGAVGYYSFQYGVAGIEAAYNAELRGDGLRDLWEEILDNTLHLPQIGVDVRATLDLDAQRAAAAALDGHSGAAVVVHVPSGRVIALASSPSYDPNRLDADWRALTRDQETSPLLNRVTAGLYQPGGALQSVMLAAILATYPDLDEAGGFVLNSEIADAQTPVVVGDVVLACLPETPNRALTLAEAYAFGCPAPFVQALSPTLTPERIWERFQVVGLLDPPQLAGFTPAVGSLPELLTGATAPDVLRAAVTGQGDLTVTPLQMVQIVAAIANQGNAVPLHLVDAIRPPDSGDWQPLDIPERGPALLRADVAAAVRLTMLQAAAQSPYVQQAARGALVLYGHSAIAYAGPDKTPYAWFVGFVDQTQGEQQAALAIVVVVENESDPGVAATIAGDTLAAAASEGSE
ncbi:MAG: hypothetical protein GXY36_16925 [Chloroflexi bacterium]|nr:hypothetical protein [Chloroflexota bacterium]